ncbi:MAG: hypothetical protein N2593_00240 [Patescibacteria group bacterium]|nr:hypothetical protein [Patescibacteria group bacterium]
MRKKFLKIKKAEIATFLTLGLVVAGAFLSILSSIMVNRQKNLASRPRAQSISLTSNSCSIGSNNCGSNYRWNCSPNSSKIFFNDINFDGNGCDPTRCPTKELPFACYVVDNRCEGGKIRYRWYGCTGQPCQNTIINQGANGPGKLVGKPIGGDYSNLTEECVDFNLIQATPTHTPTPTNYECYCHHSCIPGVIGGCWWGTGGLYKCSNDCCTNNGCPEQRTPPTQIPTLTTTPKPGGGTTAPTATLTPTTPQPGGGTTAPTATLTPTTPKPRGGTTAPTATLTPTTPQPSPTGATGVPSAIPTPKPKPGEAGGACLNVIHQDSFFQGGECNDSDFVCYRDKLNEIGKCVRKSEISKCDVIDSRYCIEMKQTNEEKNNHPTTFPWCQLPNGKWVKLVDTGTYNEDCYYQSKTLSLPSLKGQRQVKRENGKKEYNYGCKYTINNFVCNQNYEWWWNEDCNYYCDLQPSYNVRVTIENSFFQNNLSAKFYEKPTYIQIFGNFLSTSINKKIEINDETSQLNNFKKSGYSFDISIDNQELINYYNTNNLFFYLNFIIVRTKSGISETIKTTVQSTHINPDDLSIVFK